MNGDILIEVATFICFIIVAPIYLPIDWWLQRRRRKKMQKLYDKAGGTFAYTTPYSSQPSYDDWQKLQEVLRRAPTENARQLLIAYNDVHIGTFRGAAEQTALLARAMRDIIIVPHNDAFARAYRREQKRAQRQKELEGWDEEWRTSY